MKWPILCDKPANASLMTWGIKSSFLFREVIFTEKPIIGSYMGSHIGSHMGSLGCGQHSPLFMTYLGR